MPAQTPDEVLDFWFAGSTRPSWFARSEAFDALVRAELGPPHERAVRGELDAWAADPRGALALVLLLDQAPRNIHRGSANAFATDARALQYARAVVDAGLDQGLTEVEKVFLYMPFEHSESLADQDRCVALTAALTDPLWHDFAAKHRVIIARFGRFPHRNAILGRESTPEELEFLQQPGSTF